MTKVQIKITPWVKVQWLSYFILLRTFIKLNHIHKPISFTICTLSLLCSRELLLCPNKEPVACRVGHWQLALICHSHKNIWIIQYDFFSWRIAEHAVFYHESWHDLWCQCDPSCDVCDPKNICTIFLRYTTLLIHGSYRKRGFCPHFHILSEITRWSYFGNSTRL